MKSEDEVLAESFAAEYRSRLSWHQLQSPSLYCWVILDSTDAIPTALLRIYVSRDDTFKPLTPEREKDVLRLARKLLTK